MDEELNYGEDYQDYGQPITQAPAPAPQSRGWDIFGKILDKGLDIGGSILTDQLRYGGGRSTAQDLSRERQGYTGINGSGPNVPDPRFATASPSNPQNMVLWIGAALLGVVVLVFALRR